jgi:4-amino-4-deoxy-L-arabinose transferase-like glycosyltransferase
LVCAAVLLVAAGLRLWQIDFDLPEVQDVDAGKFVDAAAHIVESGELKPRDFQYPGGYTNLLALLYKISGIDGAYARHLAARLISAAGGVGMVGAAWFLARRFGNLPAAFVAALLTAVSVDCVTSSHVACTDTLMACFASLALAFAIAPVPDWRSWAAAGALAGLATGMKFSGGCVGPVIVLAAIVDSARRREPVRIARDVVIICLAGLTTLWITTPRFPADAAEYLVRLRHEAAIQRYGQLGHVQYGYLDYLLSKTATPEQPWLGTSLLSNAGPVVLVIAALAVVLALAGRAGTGGVITALYIVGYMVLISGPGHLKATRFLLPVLPALFALIGWLLEWGTTKFMTAKLATARMRPIAIAVLTIAVIFWPAMRTVQYLVLLRQPSTNTLARQWVTENLPAGTTLFASPFYLGDLWSLPVHPLTFDDTWERQYRLPEGVGPSAERTPIFVPHVVDLIAQNQAQYVVLNSYFEDGLAPTADNLRWFPASVEGYELFRAALDERADKVHSISGYAEGRAGPDITVYRLRR